MSRRKIVDQGSAPVMGISSMTRPTSRHSTPQSTVNSDMSQPTSHNALSVSTSRGATGNITRSTFSQSHSDNINLLLVGRSCNGKSATGNSILGKASFKINTRASSQAVSRPVRDNGVVNERMATIVDGLNIGENNGGDYNNIAEDICALTKAFNLSEEGFSAILIVLKFGVPYSPQETNAMKIVKTLLGDNIIRDYGICVVTHGDNFQHTLEEEEEGFKNFEQWCRMQKRDLKHLFEECKFRCILFNNRTKLVSEKKSQISKLYGFLDMMSKDRLRGFSQNMKRNAKMSHLKNEPSFVRDGTTLILENVRSHLGKIEQFQDTDKRPILESMLRVLSEFSATIQKTNNVSKNIEDCVTHIKALSMEINGIMKNLGSNGNALELKDAKMEHQQCKNYAFNKLKDAKKKSLQRERTPELETSTLETFTVPQQGSQNRYDWQTGLCSTDICKSQQFKDITSFDVNPNKFLAEGEKKIENLRTGMKKAKEDVQQAGTTYSTRIQNLLQETSDFKEILQTNSQAVSSFKRLQIDTSELERDLESMLEIPMNGRELYGHERQVKKIKIADKEDSRECSAQTHGASEEKSATQTSSQSINLLIVGCSGNGKSSTGNSILGKNVFLVSASTAGSRGRSSCMISSSHFQGQTISVIDVPGVSCESCDQKSLGEIINLFEECLEICDYEFSALLFVLKFGVRVSKQETEMVRLIKTVLGKYVLKDFGICVITYGDNFEHAVEEAAEDGEVLTFEGWCREQTGEVKSLFQECNFRCVLFDNKTKDSSKAHNQLHSLLQMVDPKKKYSKEKFVASDLAFKN